MLPAKRTLSKGKKKRRAAADAVPKYRESPMTKPEFRFYKETFPIGKNVAQTATSINPISHVAPDPEPHPRAEALSHARMQKSNAQMFPNQADNDTFQGGAKRSAAASNQFA